jgi:adenylate cyclase
VTRPEAGDDALGTLEAAGVYDPAAPDAPVLEAILRRLVRLGATTEEIVSAPRRGGLQALTVELLVGPAERLTLADVVERAGATYEDGLRLWRAWGFPPPAPDDRRFGPVDVEMVGFGLLMEQTMGADAAFHTARVMGLAVGRVAEAEVAMLRSAIEARLREEGADEDEVLSSYEAIVPMAVDASDRTLGLLNRHHIVETVRRQLAWSVGASPHNVLDTVVGFADLTGSTRLASALALDELDRALAAFEERTADILADAGATLVKRIGDAVMFSTPASEIASHVAVDLVEAFETDPVVPPVRVGLAAGPVVARRGDFYGLPVALAARLQTAAEPSTILVSSEVARRLAGSKRPGWRVWRAGSLELAGFAEPVEVHRLARD